MFSGDSPSRVKALKETQSTNFNHWPGIILFSSTTGLLMEGRGIAAFTLAV